MDSYGIYNDKYGASTIIIDKKRADHEKFNRLQSNQYTINMGSLDSMYLSYIWMINIWIL